MPSPQHAAEDSLTNDRSQDGPARTRFLRACDRCRQRKVKCDNEQPCARCRAAKVDCLFAIADKGRMIVSAPPPGMRSSSSPHTTEMSIGGSSAQPRRSDSTERPHKRRLIYRTPSPTSMSPEDILKTESTLHAYTSRDGSTRLAGSTTGLPLLAAAHREWRQSGRTGHAIDKEAGDEEWKWLASLLETDEEKEREKGTTDADGGEVGSDEELEYFPGRDMMAEQGADNLHTLVTAVIPPDLISSLLQLFFDVVYPSWPIFHVPTFCEELHKWQDPSFAALLVAVCMLATRYSSDLRCRADPSNPASGGVAYQSLFQRLRELAVNKDNVLFSTQSMFFVSLFHCVDNIPHPMAQAALAEASVRTLDGGLHREVASLALGNAIEREVRVRTSWACYCLDKQVATFCGRPAILHLWDFDGPLPKPFNPTPMDASCPFPVDDVRHTETLTQLVYVSTVLDKTYVACHQLPLYTESPFLGRMSRRIMFLAEVDDETAQEDAEAALDEYTQTLLPPAYSTTRAERQRTGLYSPSTERVLAIGVMVKMLIASRRLQLITARKGGVGVRSQRRAELLAASRQMVTIYVQLGAGKRLQHCDIFAAYSVLLAGRLILAGHISARTDGDSAHEAQTLPVLRACSGLLRQFALKLPIAQGAAEVFDETCRVCRVSLPSSSQSASQPRYAWYRPVRFRKPTACIPAPASTVPQPANTHGNATSASSVQQDDCSATAEAAMADLSTLFTPPNSAFANGNFSLPFSLNSYAAGYGGNALPDSVGQAMTNAGEPGGFDASEFSWLLPGGSIPYYFPEDQG